MGLDFTDSGSSPLRLDFKITEVDLSGVARGDPPQTLIQSIEVKLINFTDMDLTEVARGEPAPTQIKATEVKFKSNEAKADLDFH